MKKKAVFLDRDGVINNTIIHFNKIGSPRHMNEFHFMHDVKSNCQALKALHYELFIVTNQPDISRGRLDNDECIKMMELCMMYLPITDTLFCPHDDEDNCKCRKPKPGMILELAELYHIDLKKSWMIGDRDTDMAAGCTAGCRTIWLKPIIRALEKPTIQTDYRCCRLVEAVELIKLNLTQPEL